MRPESAAELGSSSSSIRSRNSSSADTPNREGARKYFGALLVGVYEGQRLKFSGRVGTGFSEKLLRSLYLELNKIRINECPFFNLPATDRSRWERGLIATPSFAFLSLIPRKTG